LTSLRAKRYQIRSYQTIPTQQKNAKNIINILWQMLAGGVENGAGGAGIWERTTWLHINRLGT